MFRTNKLIYLISGILWVFMFLTFHGQAAIANDNSEDRTTDQTPELKTSGEVEPVVPVAQSTPPAPPPQTIVYAPTPPPVVIYQVPQGQPDHLDELQKAPYQIPYQEDKAPPPGYVKVEKTRRGMIIAGSALFGGVYLFCLSFSPENRNLAIPFVGPMIAGYGYESKHSGEDDDDPDDVEALFRVYGIIGTAAQTAGIVLFIVGLASKKKMWLRQDIAGTTVQFAPTILARDAGGLGINGTF